MKQQSLYPAFQAPESKTHWEEKLWKEGFARVAGLDEAGRGAWAGPVVAAAVILKPGTDLPGVDDSKKLNPQQRDRLFDVIVAKAAACEVGIVSCELIDELNAINRVLKQHIAAQRRQPGKDFNDRYIYDNEKKAYRRVYS